MPGLTDILFDLLDKEQNVKVTDELLEWLYDDSEEYQNLVKSRDDPIGRKESLKNLCLSCTKRRNSKM